MTAPNKGKGKAYQYILEHLSHQGDDCIPWPYMAKLREPFPRRQRTYLTLSLTRADELVEANVNP